MLLPGLLGACGSAPQSGASAVPSVTTARSSSAASSASAAPTPTPELLFAVLEAKHPPDRLGFTDDTIAIVGFDGVARRKATFTPRTPPQIGNAAPILQDEAHVAAGQVFYIDGSGTVHSLSMASSAPVTAVQFGAPTPQGYQSFAVSPDGMHLLSSIYDLTPFVPPTDSDPSTQPFGRGSDPLSLTVLRADAGGSPTQVSRIDHPDMPHIDLVVSWDDTGPVVIRDVPLGTQNLTPDGWDALAAHLDDQFRAAGSLGGSCRALSELADGTTVCLEEGQVAGLTERAPDGSVRLAVPRPGSGRALSYPFFARLAPDGSRLAYSTGPLGSTGPDECRVTDLSGRTVVIPHPFYPQGWLDAATLIGSTSPAADSHLVMVRLDTPSRLIDLGFAGRFVGVVQGGA